MKYFTTTKEMKEEGLMWNKPWVFLTRANELVLNNQSM